MYSNDEFFWELRNEFFNYPELIGYNRSDAPVSKIYLINIELVESKSALIPFVYKGVALQIYKR